MAGACEGPRGQVFTGVRHMQRRKPGGHDNPSPPCGEHGVRGTRGRTHTPPSLGVGYARARPPHGRVHPAQTPKADTRGPRASRPLPAALLLGGLTVGSESRLLLLLPLPAPWHQGREAWHPTHSSCGTLCGRTELGLGHRRRGPAPKPGLHPLVTVGVECGGARGA